MYFLQFFASTARQHRDVLIAVLAFAVVGVALTFAGCQARGLVVTPPPAASAQMELGPERPEEARISYEAWVSRNEAIAREWVARIQLVEEDRAQLLEMATGLAGFLVEPVKDIPGVGPGVTALIGLGGFLAGARRRRR